MRALMAPCPCTTIPELRNGLQIFAGSVPIYRGSTLIGAVGVSGDGIDQDDFIAAGGAKYLRPTGRHSVRYRPCPRCQAPLPEVSGTADPRANPTAFG